MGTVYKRSDRGGRKGTYYASYIDAKGERVRFNTRTTDKQTAEQVLAARLTKNATRRFGIADDRSERFAAHQKKRLAVHVADFVTYLTANNRDPVHFERQKKRIEAIIEFAGWQWLSDIEPSKVDEFVSQLKVPSKAKKPDDRPLIDASQTTKKHYRTAIKSFTSWLAGPDSGGRIPFDPLAKTGRGKKTKERRLKRRALLVAEWQAIKSYIGGESFGVAAPERLLAYELALQTGLRSGELQSLTVSRLRLTGKRPTVTVPGDTTKDAIDAHQHITADLAKRLRQHTTGMPGGQRVFALPHPTNMAEMLRRDVSATREAWISDPSDDVAAKKAKKKMLAEHPDFLKPVDSSGERVDFHALRHTCGAWLALANVHPKTIQSVMRHKDITLTLETYGHLFRSMEADAVDKLAQMIAGVEPETLRETAGDT